MVPILLRRVNMWRRAAQAVAVVCALAVGGALVVAFIVRPTVPGVPGVSPPNLTPGTVPTAFEVGSYDLLGRVVSRAEAERLVDRRLRAPMVAANRASESLRLANVDGSGDEH